ncbi:MAG: hypothetical protein H7Y04_11640 [Verrucomicrobia bacterium]|nr:hypothetical protein [Cytophagales bacterium]
MYQNSFDFPSQNTENFPKSEKIPLIRFFTKREEFVKLAQVNFMNHIFFFQTKCQETDTCRNYEGSGGLKFLLEDIIQKTFPYLKKAEKSALHAVLKMLSDLRESEFAIDNMLAAPQLSKTHLQKAKAANRLYRKQRPKSISKMEPKKLRIGFTLTPAVARFLAEISEENRDKVLNDFIENAIKEK